MTFSVRVIHGSPHQGPNVLTRVILYSKINKKGGVSRRVQIDWHIFSRVTDRFRKKRLSHLYLVATPCTRVRTTPTVPPTTQLNVPCSAPMGPKFVQLCQETPYFEVFITTFHAVAGHVCWLAERGPRGVRDLVFKGRSQDKASIIVCKAMLTPTTTLAGPNGSCLTMYTCKFGQNRPQCLPPADGSTPLFM